MLDIIVIPLILSTSPENLHIMVNKHKDVKISFFVREHDKSFLKKKLKQTTSMMGHKKDSYTFEEEGL